MSFDAFFGGTLSDLKLMWENLIPFIKAHHKWAPVIVGALAFCESLAILSLIVPATAILLAIGAIIGVAHLDFTSIWCSAVIGAVLGDWLSYWFGSTFKDRMYRIYPLSRHPEMVVRGQRFFVKYGPWSVFIGRFFGPLRAVVPLIAGIFGVKFWHFQMANISSAMLWAFVLLSPGAWLAS
jgi:membrane protein DedA with SNARE-associated domain